MSLNSQRMGFLTETRLLPIKTSYCCNCRSYPDLLKPFICYQAKCLDSGPNTGVIHQSCVVCICVCVRVVCCFSTGHFGPHTSTYWQQWSDALWHMRPLYLLLRKREGERLGSAQMDENWFHVQWWYLYCILCTQYSWRICILQRLITTYIITVNFAAL